MTLFVSLRLDIPWRHKGKFPDKADFSKGLMFSVNMETAMIRVGGGTVPSCYPPESKRTVGSPDDDS